MAYFVSVCVCVFINPACAGMCGEADQISVPWVSASASCSLHCPPCSPGIVGTVDGLTEGCVAREDRCSFHPKTHQSGAHIPSLITIQTAGNSIQVLAAH